MRSNKHVISSGSVPLTQGPRLKSNATIQFEKLIKDILLAYQNKQAINVSYNAQNEMIIIANNEFYNLSQILINNPDFEQLDFDGNDLKILRTFLMNPRTTYYHVELDLERGDDEDKEYARKAIERMQKVFPTVSLDELSTVRNYTGGVFYSAINFILRSNAKARFNTIRIPYEDNLDVVLAQVGTSHNMEPDPTNPAFLSVLVNEIMMHMGMIGFVLSKNLQQEIKLCAAKSLDDIEKNIDKITNVTYALVPNGNQYKVYMIAYSKILNASVPVTINLNELLARHTKPNDNGVVVSENEIKYILAQLNAVNRFSLLENIQGLLLTKLTDVLTTNGTVENLKYEHIYRGDYINDFIKNVYLPPINDNLKRDGYSVNFPQGFYSTTGSYDRIFKYPQTLITILINPILFGKNIEATSYSYYELERLLTHKQQLIFTNLFEEENDDILEVTLLGFLARSLDGIDPYSYLHDATLLREALIALDQVIPSIENEEVKTAIKQQLSVIACGSMLMENDSSEAHTMTLDVKQRLLALTQILSLYYLNLMLSSGPQHQLFSRQASVNDDLCKVIKKVMKDIFSIHLPTNVNEIRRSHLINIPLSSKVDENNRHLIIDQDAVRNIFKSREDNTSFVSVIMRSHDGNSGAMRSSPGYPITSPKRV